LPDVASEKVRRALLWDKLQERDNVEPQQLRELGIYGGAQGIWVDKARTAGADIGPEGATVGILHTGRHYPDDLSDDGVIYHYPNTKRQPGRDLSEIQATKNAMANKLPLFVILPGKGSQAKRSVRLGWVCDFDDDSGQFLILFDAQEPPYSGPARFDSEFRLTENLINKTGTVKVRAGQQRFRFHVISQYGEKCAVCRIRHPQLLTAAHICGKSDKGSDDWRNGIPLCATHHAAFDAHLFSIDPNGKKICYLTGITPEAIGVVEDVLTTVKNCPHEKALQWRWAVAQKTWKSSGLSSA
jgi:hypothetical protein